MKLGEPLSAKQMALVSGLGGMLAAFGFLLPSARHMTTHPRYYPVWLWILLFSGLLAVGLGISVKADSKIKKGIRNGRWEEEEVVSLRAVLESPLWVTLGMACIIGCGVTLVAFPAHQNVGWALMVTGQSFSRLAMSVRLPQTEGTASARFRNFAPIRSEHWGER